MHNIIIILKTAFFEFKGYGMYFALLLIAMLYIFLIDEDKKKKTFLIGYSTFLFIIVINNPIFCMLVKKIITIDEYHRLYYILPVGLIISYAISKVVSYFKDKRKKYIAFIALLIIIGVSGKFAYSYFDEEDTEEYAYNFLGITKVNNLYGIPDEALEITKIISENEIETEKVLLAPTKIVPYVRQYDASIRLVYGRNPKGYGDIDGLEQYENGDLNSIWELAVKAKCNYIVMKKETEIKTSLEGKNLELIGETENYNIYRNNDNLK